MIDPFTRGVERKMRRQSGKRGQSKQESSGNLLRKKECDFSVLLQKKERIHGSEYSH